MRAILLDVDGTLVDSNDAHAAAWSEACRAFGFERPIAFFRPLIGMGGDQVLPRVDPSLTDHRDPGKAIAARRGEVFKANLSTLQPTPGARALVERLHASGLRCIVASSAKADELEALLAIAGIGSFIAVKTTSEDAAASKPAPDIVVTAPREGHVKATEALLIGDTPYDITSLRRMGRPRTRRCAGDL